MGNFNPNDIASCKAWYDAMDFSTIKITSSEVLQIIDKSGNGNHQIGTAGTAPAWSITGTGSALPAIQFASGKFTSCADNATLDFTTFFSAAVYQRDTDAGAVQGIFGKQTAGGTNREFMMYISASDQPSVQTTTDGTSGTLAGTSGRTNSTGVPAIIGAANDGVNTYQFGDNITKQNAAAVSVFNGAGTLDLGRAFGNTGQIVISEVLFYTVKPSDSDIRKIMHYLASKWRIPVL